MLKIVFKLAQKDFGSTTELIPLLNSAVIVPCISLKCWANCFLASPQQLCGISLSIQRWVFTSSQFQTKSERNKRLAKIGWRAEAAMKGNFVGPYAKSSFVTMWYVKTTRKPEDQEWRVGCSLEVQEFVHLVFQKRFLELIKSSGFIGKGFSYTDQHTCHNHALIVWSVGQLSNTI